MADLSEEEKHKAEEKKRMKAAVRIRLEALTRKKGFLTPERKKKLKTLFISKATKDLQLEQEKKAEERRKIISERAGTKKSVDGANEETLKQICKEYYTRICKLEDLKYDLEYEVRQKHFVVNELSIEVNGLKGKFVRPPLKTVSKYGTSLEKMAKVAAKAEMDLRNNLKRVESRKFKMSDDEKDARPEWALGPKDQRKSETEADEVEVEG